MSKQAFEQGFYKRAAEYGISKEAMEEKRHTLYVAPQVSKTERMIHGGLSGAMLGGTGGMLGGELSGFSNLKHDHDGSDMAQKMLIGALAGAALGAPLGTYLGKKHHEHREKEFGKYKRE